MVKIGVLRLIKIILRWSTFDIGTRILHNSHWINRIWMGIQLDMIVFKSYFKYSWGGYESITGFRGNCHVSYTRYMFWCKRRVLSHHCWPFQKTIQALSLMEVIFFWSLFKSKASTKTGFGQPTQYQNGRRWALCGNLKYIFARFTPYVQLIDQGDSKNVLMTD